MKKYEAVFILDMRKAEDDGKAFAAQFEEKIKSWGGAVSQTLFMGRKPFAREIKKRKTGVYCDFFFELDPAKEAQIREDYRLDERVLRVLIVIDDRPAKIITLPELPPPTFGNPTNAAAAPAEAAEATEPAAE